MNSQEVSNNLKRASDMIIQISENAIEFYRSRIRDLEGVIKAAQKAGADEALPKSELEADIQNAITQDVGARRLRQFRDANKQPDMSDSKTPQTQTSEIAKQL